MKSPRWCSCRKLVAPGLAFIFPGRAAVETCRDGGGPCGLCEASAVPVWAAWAHAECACACGTGHRAWWPVPAGLSGLSMCCVSWDNSGSGHASGSWMLSLRGSFLQGKWQESSVWWPPWGGRALQVGGFKQTLSDGARPPILCAGCWLSEDCVAVLCEGGQRLGRLFYCISQFS